MLVTTDEQNEKYISTNSDQMSIFFVSFSYWIGSIEMTSSTVTSPPPIILVPAESLTLINSGPAITVENITQSKKSFDINRFIHANINILKREAKALFTFHPTEWISAFRCNPKFPLFVLGDIDGFVALFMNNLATLLAVILGLRLVFEDDIIYGKIIPG